MSSIFLDNSMRYAYNFPWNYSILIPCESLRSVILSLYSTKTYVERVCFSVTYLFQICALSEDINLFCELFLKVLECPVKELVL